MNNQNISFFYNLMDTACTYVYEETKKKYLDCLILISEEITENKVKVKVSKETREKLILVYEQIEEKDFINEEIRLAMELLVVKGLKHANFPLDLMIPNTINYLFTIIISSLYDKDISILDATLKTGNMLMCICNNFPHNITSVGIEENKRLVELARTCATLEDNMLKIYYQNYEKEVLDNVDLVIGSLEEKAWDIFLERLNNVKEDGYFVYLINNDFFSDSKMKEYKNELDKACTFISLITLPNSLFQEGQIGKSIVIGQRKTRSNYNINIVTIENMEKETLATALEKIKFMIEEIKGE